MAAHQRGGPEQVGRGPAAAPTHSTVGHDQSDVRAHGLVRCTPVIMEAVLRDDLTAHLKTFNTAPFLFVGAGMSRRYLGLDGWEGLLKRFADLTPTPFVRYRAEANGDYPTMAARIAAGFSDVWWDEASYEDSRERYEDDATHLDSPLKIEISDYMDGALANLDESGTYADEIEALKKVQVDGIITTNYDRLLERFFPEFKPFVGQDDVLFSETQSVGEIYKIHGSTTHPNSLVLTDADYADFNRRNSYLAAKLLTIFVDHPVVFLGYSMQDPNIIAILNSIAAGLTTERLEKLQDRLIFIEWDGGATTPRLESAMFSLGASAVPVRRATVADYVPVYEALAAVERKFSVRVLRQLKERVYDLVKTTDPVGALRVIDIDEAKDVKDLDVVVGVGVVNQLGYLALDRDALLEDVLSGKPQLNAERLVQTALPALLKRARLTPVFKYLRGANLLDDDGSLVAGAVVPPEIRERVEAQDALISPSPKTYVPKADKVAKEVGDFAGLVKAESDEPWRVVMYVSRLAPDGQDPEALREFLIEHRNDLFESGDPTRRTQWIKAVLLYDWLVYGRQLKAKSKPKPKQKPSRKGRAKSNGKSSSSRTRKRRGG